MDSLNKDRTLLLLSTLIFATIYNFLIPPVFAEEIQPSLPEGYSVDKVLPIVKCKDLIESIEVQASCSSQKKDSEVPISTSEVTHEITENESEDNSKSHESYCKQNINLITRIAPSMNQILSEHKKEESILEIPNIAESNQNNETLTPKENINLEKENLQQTNHENNELNRSPVLSSDASLISIEEALFLIVQAYSHEVSRCISSLENPHVRQLVAPPTQQLIEDFQNEKDTNKEKDIEELKHNVERARGGIQPF